MVISVWLIGKDLEGGDRGLILRYYPGICLQGLRETTKDLRQDKQYQGRNMNPGPPEYNIQ
jgi:hypothetical protein